MQLIFLHSYHLFFVFFLLFLIQLVWPSNELTKRIYYKFYFCADFIFSSSGWWWWCCHLKISKVNSLHDDDDDDGSTAADMKNKQTWSTEICQQRFSNFFVVVEMLLWKFGKLVSQTWQQIHQLANIIEKSSRSGGSGYAMQSGPVAVGGPKTKT